MAAAPANDSGAYRSILHVLTRHSTAW